MSRVDDIAVALTAEEIIEWHKGEMNTAIAWEERHRTMNKHGRAYHDEQAEKNALLAALHMRSMMALAKQTGVRLPMRNTNPAARNGDDYTLGA